MGIGADAGVGHGHAGAPYVGDLPYRGAAGQTGGDLQSGILPHAVAQNIRLGIEEDGAAHLVLPVVVVSKAAQTGLQPADDDGDVPEHLPHPVGVDDGGVVRAQSGLAAGGVGVIVAALAGGGVVGHHGVDVAGGDQHPQAGAAQSGEGGGIAPVRLGHNGHPVARRL